MGASPDRLPQNVRGPCCVDEQTDGDAREFPTRPETNGGEAFWALVLSSGSQIWRRRIVANITNEAAKRRDNAKSRRDRIAIEPQFVRGRAFLLDCGSTASWMRGSARGRSRSRLGPTYDDSASAKPKCALGGFEKVDPVRRDPNGPPPGFNGVSFAHRLEVSIGRPRRNVGIRGARRVVVGIGRSATSHFHVRCRVIRVV
jgi:hypothetical protein